MAGWQDIKALEERIYDAVDEFLQYPDGYDKPVLVIRLDDGEYDAEVEDGYVINEDKGIYDIYSFISDGEPDNDRISDVANSWIFLD